MMRKLYIGNVVKLDSGYKVIITNFRTVADKKITDWVSFNSSNVSGSTSEETYNKREMCWGCETNTTDYPEPECEACEGTGYFIREIPGMDKAEYLADNTKSFIMDILTNKRILD